MTTWNVFTVTNTTGTPIHEGMMRAALAEHAGLDEVRDDFGADPFDMQEPNEFQGSWHSKYSLELDLEALSEFLGAGFTVSHVEEWDAEEPGRTDTVWTNGKRNERASSQLVDVSDELRTAAGDALTNPRILTWDEITDPDLEPALDYTTVRFLILPATP